MKKAFLLGFFFSVCATSTVCFSQVSFDNGQTFYTDSSQSMLCNGKFRTMYPGYKLKTTTSYSKGKLHGEALEYFEEGGIKRKMNYVNGLLEGEALEYYPGSVIVKSRFNFLNGVKNGECFNYNEFGEITEKWVYENGVLKP